MNREECLNSAREIVTKDRNNQYGAPEDNFGCIADMWNAYLGVDYQITPVDVAIMLALLKVARISTGTVKEDSFVDLCGYGACACELATRGE